MKTKCKKYFLLLLLTFPISAYSQFCADGVLPPTTIQGITVTTTSTGSVTDFLASRPNLCGLYKVPINKKLIGGNGAFTYSLHFSLPVNQITFNLSSTGQFIFEVFTFTTNTGTPALIDQGSCFTTINDNIITSGGDPNMGGGGNFTISNPNPFSQLTVSGPGGALGSLISFCSTSIFAQKHISKQICIGDSIQIGSNFQKEEGLYSETIVGGKHNGEDSVVFTQLTVTDIAIDLGKDTTFCKGNLLLDASFPEATYRWQDNSTHPTFEATEEGRYWAQITIGNCSASDTFVVHPGGDGCEAIIDMPNVFTPNRDGMNDVFRPIHIEKVKGMNTKIYNKWGAVVFETNNLTLEWTAHDVPSGTYFWVVSYTNIFDEEYQIKGIVTAIKEK